MSGVKEVVVEVVVEKEVIKEVKVPGETIVVTKEVQIQKFREAPMLAQLVAAGTAGFTLRQPATGVDRSRRC